LPGQAHFSMETVPPIKKNAPFHFPVKFWQGYQFYVAIHHIYIYGNYIWIYGLWSILTGILDYLREGFPWPVRPFKHTESNSFKHTLATSKSKYRNSVRGISYYLRGLAVWPALHIFKCRYRIYTVLLYTYQWSREILIHVLLQRTTLGNIMFIKTPSGTQQLKKKIILARPPRNSLLSLGGKSVGDQFVGPETSK